MKNNDSLLSNVSWKFAERITAQIVSTIVSIIIARVLDPEHYGIIAIVNIFITLANVFVSDGFGSALIQKKDADKIDFSSVLYFNISFSIVLYIVLFIIAPFVSAFYGEGYEILTPVLRVLSIRIILSSINSIQHAYVAKKMMFEKFFWATLIGTIISAVVGIWLAYSGFGVWALVAQYLTNTTIDTVALIVLIRKKPLFVFSWKRVKGLVNFGSKVLATNLLIVGYTELRALVIGKMYSSEDLAYFDKGKQFPSLIINNVNTSLSAVLFPKMASEQDDIDKIKQITKTSIRISSFVFCPMMLGLLAVAPTFVYAVLTEKWMPCVPYIQLLAINYMFYPIHSANMSAIKATGHSKTLLLMEIIKKSIELIVFLCVLWYGVDAIVWGMISCSTVFVLFNAWPNRKNINYSISEQIKDIFPSLFMSIVMAVSVYFMNYIPFNKWIVLLLQIVAGVLIYFSLAIITKNTELTRILKIIKKNK